MAMLNIWVSSIIRSCFIPKTTQRLSLNIIQPDTNKMAFNFYLHVPMVKLNPFVIIISSKNCKFALKMG